MIYTLIRKDKYGDVDSIISFDSVSSMDESWSATVSTHTVEKGFNISDNINIEPEVYSIEAIISSYSLFMKDKEITWNGSRFKSREHTDSQSHIKAREELIKIFKDGSVLSILESTANSNQKNLALKNEELRSGYIKEIDNCVITSLSISHPSSGTGAFYVSLKIQKIYTATVTVEQLQEGEAISLLTPMQAKETNVSSNTNSGRVSDGSDVEAAGMGVLPEDDTGVPTSNSSGGITWEEGNAILQKDLSKIRDDEKALLRIHKFQLRTNSICRLERTASGGYAGDCTRV